MLTKGGGADDDNEAIVNDDDNDHEDCEKVNFLRKSKIIVESNIKRV